MSTENIPREVSPEEYRQMQNSFGGPTKSSAPDPAGNSLTNPSGTSGTDGSTI